MYAPIICDICGFKNPAQTKFCAGCNVDLFESKEGGTEKKKIRKRRTDQSVHSSQKDEKEIIERFRIIKWCWLKTWELPHFLILMSQLAQGKSKLGFCDCNICKKGYRELLAIQELISGNEVSSHSREIVIKAREQNMSKISLDVSNLLLNYTLENSAENPIARTSKSSGDSAVKEGKIFIEIDENIIENAILKVLQSEKGQQIIQEGKASRKGKERIRYSLR